MKAIVTLFLNNMITRQLNTASKVFSFTCNVAFKFS